MRIEPAFARLLLTAGGVQFNNEVQLIGFEIRGRIVERQVPVLTDAQPRANVHSRRSIAGITRYARPFKAWDFRLGLPEPRDIRTLRRSLPAGIITTTADAAVERTLQKLGLPLVNCSSDLEKPTADRVMANNLEAARLAADHLLHLSYRDLAFFGDGSSHASRTRGDAFLDRCNAAGATTHRFERPDLTSASDVSTHARTSRNR